MSSRLLLARAKEPERGFTPDPRLPGAAFQPGGPLAPPPGGQTAEQAQVQPAAAGPDPLEEAFARGLAEGEALAEARFAARLAELEARYAGLGEELAELVTIRKDALRIRLAELVAHLCEAALAPMALDPQALADRVERAAALLQRASDQARLRLHPDDADLLRPLLRVPLTILPDATLERGALRLETEEGGVEDGPEQWREAVREALGLC